MFFLHYTCIPIRKRKPTFLICLLIMSTSQKAILKGSVFDYSSHLSDLQANKSKLWPIIYHEQEKIFKKCKFSIKYFHIKNYLTKYVVHNIICLQEVSDSHSLPSVIDIYPKQTNLSQLSIFYWSLPIKETVYLIYFLVIRVVSVIWLQL